MTVLRFLDVELTLHEAALIDTGSDPVAPVTVDVLPGTTVRGLLNRACGNDERLREVLIRSERVQAAPALPLVRAGDKWRTAAPAALSLGTSGVTVVDTRETHPDLAVEAERGLVVTDGATWHPALVRTRTEQRLGRDRTRPGGDATGPFTQTVIAAGQRFRSRLRIVAASEDEAAAVGADVAAALHDPGGRRGFAVGAGADNSYGGSLSIDVGGGDPVPSPVPEPSSRPRGTRAGDRVDLVLRSPALVRDPVTGEPDPAALGTAVLGVLDDVLGAAAATVEAVSTVRHLLGGFHALYRGTRPQHWAAAAGSTVAVVTARDLSVEDWERVTARRVGDRAVDGFGVLGVEPTARGALGRPVEHRWPDRPASVRLPDGLAVPRVPADAVVSYLRNADAAPDPSTWQLTQLQDRLLWTAAREAIGDDAARVVTGTPTLPARHLLGTLREAAASTTSPGPVPLTPLPPGHDRAGNPDVNREYAAALDALDAAVEAMAAPRTTGSGRSKDTTPAQTALSATMSDGRTLRRTLCDRDTALPDDVRAELDRAVLWPDDPDPVIDAWIGRHRTALRLLVVQTLLDELVGAGSEDDR